MKIRFPKLILAIVIALILTLGGGFTYYFFFNKTPKTEFLSIINKEFKQLNNEKIISNNKMLMKLDLNLNQEAIGFNKPIAFKTEFNFDLTSLAFSNVNQLILDNDQSLEVKTYFKDQKIYIKSDDIYSNILYMAVPNIEENNSAKINYQELEEVTKEIVKITAKNIKEELFTSGQEDITIENKSYNATKYTLVLTSKDINEITYKSLEYINSNEKLLTKILNIYNDISTSEESLTLADLKNEINDLIKSLKEEEVDANNQDKIIIAIYKSKDILAIKLSITQYDETKELLIYKLNNAYNISNDPYKIVMTPTKDNKSSNFKIDVYATDSSELINMLSMNLTISEGQDVVIPDLVNAQEINSLTEEEQQQISENLMQNEFISSLSSTFSGNIGIDNSDSDYIVDNDNNTDNNVIDNSNNMGNNETNNDIDEW